MDKGFKRGLAAAALLVLAACASTPVSKGGGGPASAQVDRRLETQAAAFESFMRNARGIDATFANPAAVAEGLRIGSGYEPRQLEAGMVAYAALAALQEPKFVAGVRKAAQDKSGKGLAARLAARPDLAASPVVSRGLAVAALSVMGESGRAGALMSEPRSGMCVRVAKLNLYQCLAAAGPYYEDIYCLAQHAMLEPSGGATDAVRPIRTAQR